MHVSREQKFQKGALIVLLFFHPVCAIKESHPNRVWYQFPSVRIEKRRQIKEIGVRVLLSSEVEKGAVDREREREDYTSMFIAIVADVYCASDAHIKRY